MPQLPLMASVGKSSPSPVLAGLLRCCSSREALDQFAKRGGKCYTSILGGLALLILGLF